MILYSKSHHGDLKELLFYVFRKDTDNYVTSQKGFIMHEEPLLLVYKSLIPGGSVSTPHQISLQTVRLSAALIHQTKLKMCELQVMRVFFSIFMFLLHILKLLVILS